MMPGGAVASFEQEAVARNERAQNEKGPVSFPTSLGHCTGPLLHTLERNNDPLKTGASANLFSKGSESKFFSSMGQIVSVLNTQPFSCSIKAARDSA